MIDTKKIVTTIVIFALLGAAVFYGYREYREQNSQFNKVLEELDAKKLEVEDLKKDLKEQAKENRENRDKAIEDAVAKAIRKEEENYQNIIDDINQKRKILESRLRNAKIKIASYNAEQREDAIKEKFKISDVECLESSDVGESPNCTLGKVATDGVLFYVGECEAAAEDCENKIKEKVAENTKNLNIDHADKIGKERLLRSAIKEALEVAEGESKIYKGAWEFADQKARDVVIMSKRQQDLALACGITTNLVSSLATSGFVEAGHILFDSTGRKIGYVAGGLNSLWLYPACDVIGQSIIKKIPLR